MYFGQIVSLINCKKCHCSIEIYANDETKKCPICGYINDLKINLDYFNIKNNKE